MKLPLSEFMRWSELDRGLVIAEARVKRLTGPLGQWMPDATSDRADPTNYDDPLRYVASEEPHTDWAEKAKLDAEEAWRKKWGEKANMNGLFWTVEPLDPTS